MAVGETVVLITSGPIRSSFYDVDLLQLARPESVFFCRELPKAYVNEYLRNQEHFNVVRFFHHLLQAHFIPEYQQPYQSNKWTVFTRASGELLRLHTDTRLKEIILSPLQAINGKEFNLNCMSVFSLNSLPSSVQCDSKVSEFYDSAAQSIMICVADMSVCTVSQVNYFRNAVDYSSMHNTSKLVILILHYPPEMNILSKSCYHAIFLNRWDYIYIDSLGITTGTDEGNV